MSGVTIPTDFGAGHFVVDSDLRQYRTAIQQLTTWDAFTAFTYSGSWGDYGSGFGGGRYRLDPVGKIVHLAGLVQNTANAVGSGNPIATLPAGFRPTHEVILAAAGVISGNEVPISISVTTAGNIYVRSTCTTAKASTGYVSLEACRFALDQ